MSQHVNIQSAVSVNITSYISANTYVSAASATNGVNGTANTSSYAAFSATSNTSSGEIFYQFGDLNIPTGATIDSITCQFRGYINNTKSGTNSVMMLSNNTEKGTSVSVTSTSQTAYTISPGTWTASELSNVRLRIRIIKSSSQTNRYYRFRFYGATLTVNYTLQGTNYEVSFQNNTTQVTTVPNTTQLVYQGNNQDIKLYTNDYGNLIFKDNNVDVKSNLTHITTAEVTTTLYPSTLIDSSSAVTNSGNACTQADSTTAATVKLSGDAYMIYGFDVSSIPQDADIVSVACSAKASKTGTSSSANMQLYNGSTAKGSPTVVTNTAGISALTTGTWNRSELNNIRICVSGHYTGSQNYNLSFYGADLSILYTVEDDYYLYTISNISADHVISIGMNTPSEVLYLKINGIWVAASKVFNKSNGSWIQQTSFENLFENDNVYILK